MGEVVIARVTSARVGKKGGGVLANLKCASLLVGLQERIGLTVLGVAHRAKTS